MEGAAQNLRGRWEHWDPRDSVVGSWAKEVGLAQGT